MKKLPTFRTVEDVTILLLTQPFFLVAISSRPTYLLSTESPTYIDVSRLKKKTDNFKSILPQDINEPSFHTRAFEIGLFGLEA